MTQLGPLIEILDQALPVFHLRGRTSSYVLTVTEHGHLEHVHFGDAVSGLERDGIEALQTKQPTHGPGVKYVPGDDSYCLDFIPLEYSGMGKGDFRLPPVELKLPDGTFIADFVYATHRVVDQTLAAAGLPGAIAAGRDAQTLEITLLERLADVRLILTYTVFADSDVLVRRATLRNEADGPVVIRRLMSQMVDLPNLGYDLVTFDGSWISEGHRHVRPVAPGVYVNSSLTGTSSARHNPGVLLAEHGAGEDHGVVYGFNLVYSGNHYTAVELAASGLVRVMSGINPVGFEWTLPPGEEFATPEAVLTYSRRGFNGASAHLHDFVNTHIVRGEWANRERPVLLNNWEATFFDFDHKSVIAIAKAAKRLGADLFVLDDGWFGDRFDDHAGLGDYRVNTTKLPRGLGALAAEITGLGLSFGLWFEPEMTNRDSDLFRAHPDWVIRVPGRVASEGRHQLVLDLCQAAVRDHIVEQVGAVLDAHPIAYVKWDANRDLCDLWSPACPPGEVAHRYVLGLYEVLERIFGPRPGILLETCASGGNRFDLGMLCYSPQIWTSDCTDPIERLAIQVGLSYLYPQSTMGAHVAASPSVQTLRDTPLTTRFNVAALGVLGYELDPRRLVPSERREIAAQIAFYKAHRRTLQYGRFVRSDKGKPHQVDVSIVSPDARTIVAGHFQTAAVAADRGERLPLPPLDPHRRYRVSSRPQTLAVRDFGQLVRHATRSRLARSPAAVAAVDRVYRIPDTVEAYEGTGATLAHLKLNNQFLGGGYDRKVRLLGDYGSALFMVEALE